MLVAVLQSYTGWLLNRGHIHPHAVAIYQTFENLRHLIALLEDQVPVVLELIHRVFVTETTPFALRCVERTVDAGGVDPTPANCCHSPYSRVIG